MKYEKPKQQRCDGKETVMAVILVLKRPMICYGLLIKMHLLGVRGKMSNWIMDFLNMKKQMSTTVG